MAGDFRPGSDHRRDWNALCDPYATAVAFRHHPPRHVHVGLDVTLRCRLSADEVRQRYRGPILTLALQMVEVWFARSDGIVFHDPLAAALVFDESICDLHRGVSVEPSTGRTAFSANPSGPDEVALDVRPDAFFERFFAAFA
jgi:purine nucleosidase